MERRNNVQIITPKKLIEVKLLDFWNENNLSSKYLYGYKTTLAFSEVTGQHYPNENVDNYRVVIYLDLQ